MTTSRLEIRVRDRRSGLATDHSFTHGPVRIGRDSTCELQLADPYVSHMHAVLETDEQGARLVDLGGTNGLRVAGRRLAPHAAIPVGSRLCVSLGPFDLEVVHTPDRDRQATSGALAEPGPAELEQLHASLRHLHTLHAPHVAARQAFETALADAVHTFHTAGDQPAVRRILAEFPTTDHAHLLLTATSRTSRRADPSTSSPRESPQASLAPHPSAPSPGLSTPSAAHAPAPLDLSTPAVGPSPTASPDVPPLSFRASSLEPRPPAPHLNLPAAPASPPPARSPAAPTLPLIAEVAQVLLPDRRPPANLDEARRFLARLVDTLRTFAAGVGALQHLRLQQARDLHLTIDDHVNPLLTRTSADELLAELLAWRDDTDRGPELLDAFAVLTAHARAHVCAALAAARHLAAELAPLSIDRHASRGLLRSRARWHSFLARYTACLGDGSATSGTLRASFRAAYLDELDRHGLAVAARTA